jgi:hypothetical protein
VERERKKITIFIKELIQENSPCGNGKKSSEMVLNEDIYASFTCRRAAARRNLASLMILVSAKPCKGLCPLAASSI